MVKLNERLDIMAERAGSVKTMADIGTDHGFLPLYMLAEGKCEKAILTDISPNSLAKAKENLDGCRGDHEFRLGDGLEVLESGEADTVVIGGMGGNLIAEMLGRDIRHTSSFGKFVLQPRSGQDVLRKWLCDNGFAIVNEDVVREGDFLPEIITALPAGKAEGAEKLNGRALIEEAAGMADEEHIYMVPPWIIHAGGHVEEFLIRNMDRKKAVLENVMLSKKRDVDTEDSICRSIYYLKKLLRRYRDEK